MKTISIDEVDTLIPMTHINMEAERTEEPFNNPIILCDHCGKPHNRKRFCSNKCKDQWHNINNPVRFERMKDRGLVSEDFDPDDPWYDIHPSSGDAIQQY
jgi:hypothetical protein